MLRFFYTGSVSYGLPQTDPTKSLGGSKSGSEVPNGSIGVLFPSISYVAQRDGLSECRGVILVNEGDDIAKLEAYFEYPDTVNFSKLLIGVEPLNANFAIQRLVRADSIPYSVEFKEAVGVDNKVTILENFVSGSAIGIWFKREVISPSPADTVTDENLEEFLTNLKKAELINLNFVF